MALYRCASCGSPNVVTDTQKEGYDYVKGAIGTAVLGAGGAVAGVNGKKSTVFKCPDCGLTLNYSMPEEIRRTIDRCLIDINARENIRIAGMSINWDTIKMQYKNIEESRADIIARSHLDNNQKQFLNDFSAILDEEELFEDDCLPVYIGNTKDISNKKKELEEKYNNLQKSFTLQKEDLAKNIQQQKTTLQQEIEEINTLLPTLGFFKFIQKLQLKEKLASIDNQLIELDSQLNTKLQEIDKEISNSNQKMERDKRDLEYAVLDELLFLSISIIRIGSIGDIANTFNLSQKYSLQEIANSIVRLRHDKRILRIESKKQAFYTSFFPDRYNISFNSPSSVEIGKLDIPRELYSNRNLPRLDIDEILEKFKRMKKIN